MQPVPRSRPLDLNLADLELLYHYLTTTTKAQGQRADVTLYIEATEPRLAQQYPWLMSGILAQAAIHLSRLCPARQAHYNRVAAAHHDKAFPDFKSALQRVDRDNCQAVIWFSKKLLWCSMASDSSGGWLPQWFALLIGSCQIVKRSEAWLTEGPHVLVPLRYTDAFWESVECSQLTRLAESSPWQEVCLALRDAFARIAMGGNTPYRNGINSWISTLSDAYLEALQERDSWAQVVLAYFCVLLHRSETVWFMQGHADCLYKQIVEDLKPCWRPFLQWPECEIRGDLHVAGEADPR